MRIFPDIETVGTTDPAVIERIAAGIKPPGNLKKAESIEKWIAEEKQAAVDEAVRKTAFDGTYGRIVCIGYAIDDKSALAACGEDEAQLIRGFYAALAEHYDHRFGVTVVGHNVLGFDLKFLWQRSVVHNIQPPKYIPFKAKPWDGQVFDTMVEWNSDKDRRISLDSLCKTLGITSPKGELDGSKVGEYFQAKRYEEIATYCAGDVEATRKVYQRLTFA